MSTGRHVNGSVISPPRIDLQTGHSTSWTDDLPVCRMSGVGFSTNQIYREDGNRREEHEFEDKSFHFCQDDVYLYGVFDGHDGARASNFAAQRMPAELLLGQLAGKNTDGEDDVYLYGVFDGHDGARASNFAAQRMPAELLLGQLAGKNTDEEVKEVLYQAFVAVEKSFFESIDEQLAARTTLQLQLPEGTSYHEACQQYPDIINKLHDLDKEISGGTTGTVVLIHQNKLYVANVGDTRALLVRTDKNGIMSVSQMTVDHTIDSEEEQRRLATLGLEMDKLIQTRKIGTSDCTRCIGDFHTKGGYKDIDILSTAVREPVIGEPHVTGGIPIDTSCSFLIIMSDGLYHALIDATEVATVNTEVASMVASEFGVQATLNGVAQACVDKVVRIHHDSFMMGSSDVKARCHKRGDITLLVRNFNYKLPNAIGTPTGGNRFLPVSVPYYAPRTTAPPTVVIPDVTISSSNTDTTDEMLTPVASTSPASNQGGTSTLETTNTTARYSPTSTGTYSTTNSTQSSGETRFPSRFYKREKLELDENGRVAAYVDFSDFYRAIEAMTDSQRETLDNEVKPKSGYETITEENSLTDAQSTASETTDKPSTSETS